MTTTRKQKWDQKQLYDRFKRQVNNILHQKIWTWLRKGNLKRETESLLVAAQDNAIRTNHIKATIDKTQQNSKCRLCGDRDKTINHIISKLAQKDYKARHDWAGKVIHWEMCRKYQRCLRCWQVLFLPFFYIRQRIIIIIYVRKYKLLFHKNIRICR